MGGTSLPESTGPCARIWNGSNSLMPLAIAIGSVTWPLPRTLRSEIVSHGRCRHQLVALLLRVSKWPEIDRLHSLTTGKEVLPAPPAHRIYSGSGLSLIGLPSRSSKPTDRATARAAGSRGGRIMNTIENDSISLIGLCRVQATCLWRFSVVYQGATGVMYGVATHGLAHVVPCPRSGAAAAGLSCDPRSAGMISDWQMSHRPPMSNRCAAQDRLMKPVRGWASRGSEG